MNLQLIPFHKEFGPKICEWNLVPTTRRFWRGVKRYLTLEECENLPRMFNLEVLGILDPETGLVGLVEFNDESSDSTRFTMLVGPEYQRNGIMGEALIATEKYVFEIKGVKFLLTECSKEAVTVQKALEARGFVKIGEIPDYCQYNGKTEDAVLYYKTKQSWDS